MSSNDTSLVVRAVWFFFVGWWATGVWLSIAWFLNASIIGLPLGIKMINRVPKVLTLKEPSENQELMVESSGGDSPSLPIRAVYFIFVGWWFSGIWMAIAYLISLTVIGLPISIKMFNKLPYVVSLYSY